MFSTITTEPSTTMPKSSAPRESRLAGMWRQVEQDRSKKKRERNGERHDERTANVAQEQEKHDDDQDDALAQVVQHGVGGEVHQVAAVKVRDDLDARRQHVAVDEIHLFVQGRQGLFGIGAFAQQHDALHHVIVVVNLAVLAMQRLAEFPQADFGPLRHHGNVAHADGRAVLRL